MSQPYDRVFNFSAGPCTLPVEVLEQIRDELLNWHGTGMSVMEMSHRSKAFEGILNDTIADLRTLMSIPDDYAVLFLQGGASLQNTMVALNLLGKGGVGDYVVTGAWGKKSAEAGLLTGNARVVYDGKSHNYSTLPELTALEYSADAAYIHTTSNETIQGVEFPGDVDLPAPHVCDMSSDILSRPVDVAKYGLIYAGAQKNMGPAGTTVVIVRKDLLERTPEKTQPMLDYRLMAENNSLYNTPPCFAIYACGLVYKWVLKQGGLEKMAARNADKAKLVYDAIDASGGFYTGHADKPFRSKMNVTFRLPSDELTDEFVKEAKSHKLDGLKGHRSVGGIRASIYNAFPAEGCRVLADFMAEFASKKG